MGDFEFRGADLALRRRVSTKGRVKMLAASTEEALGMCGALTIRERSIEMRMAHHSIGIDCHGAVCYRCCVCACVRMDRTSPSGQ